MMLAGFLRTTIMLISVCALGVTGHVDTLTARDGYMIAETEARITMGWGGFVVMNGRFLAEYPGAEEIARNEYGHLLQEQKYGPLHEVLVVIPSLISAVVSRSAEAHDGRWFEVEASRLGAQ